MVGGERDRICDVVDWIELAREGDRAAESSLFAYCRPGLEALVTDASRSGSRGVPRSNDLLRRVFLETMHSIENHPRRIGAEEFLAHLRRVAGSRIRDELAGRGPAARRGRGSAVPMSAGNLGESP